MTRCVICFLILFCAFGVFPSRSYAESDADAAIYKLERRIDENCRVTISIANTLTDYRRVSHFQMPALMAAARIHDLVAAPIRHSVWIERLVSMAPSLSGAGEGALYSGMLNRLLGGSLERLVRRRFLALSMLATGSFRTLEASLYTDAERAADLAWARGFLERFRNSEISVQEFLLALDQGNVSRCEAREFPAVLAPRGLANHLFLVLDLARQQER